MRYLKFLRISLVILIFTFTSFSVLPSLSSVKSNDGIFPPQGSYFKYRLSYERILPNGDLLGINGNVKIYYLSSANSTHINVTLEAIVDLIWIQGKQDLNITQNIRTRTITINAYQGEIIRGILYYFGDAIQFYNPVFISPEMILNQSDVTIWSYSAVYYNTRTIKWNYKEISVADYFFEDENYSNLRINSSYHLSTGILIYARCHFLQQDLYGLIQHILFVYLESTTIPIDGVTDISSLLFFIGFASIFSIIPIIIIIIWLFKHPKIILEGGS